MRSIKGIIVELAPKRLAYNGVELEYDFINKTAKTKVFSDISIASDYNSPLWCPDSGIVVESDDPQILVGDTVILEYFAVVRKLGKSIERYQQAPDAIFEEVNGRVRIPVQTRNTSENYVYAIFRNGEFVPYNDFEIVELIADKVSDKVYTLRFDKAKQSYVQNDVITKCKVLYGQYAGMTCIFNPDYLLGEAQKSIIDGKEVRFIQSDYIIAQLN